MDPKQLKGLKIVELRAENLMRLKAIEIRPTGHVVEITGKNDQGKSTILDAIWLALEDASAIPEMPIRLGENEALIELDLGPIKVTRVFRTRAPTEKDRKLYTTNLFIESPDGARYTNPREILDSLISTISFDPLAFSRQKPAEQYDVLRGFVPGIDFDQIQRLQDGDYARRRDLRRDAGNVRARADGIRIPGELAEAVDLDDLVQQLQIAGVNNANRQTEVLRRDTLRNEAETNRQTIVRLDALIADMTNKISEAEARKRDCVAAIDAAHAYLQDAPPIPDPVATDAIQVAITEGREKNSQIERHLRARQDKTTLTAEADDLDEQVADLTERMDAREEEKKAAIAAAKMPIEGLAFGEKQILLNGVPFAQASQAIKIRTSVAIAFAQNPNLRVVRIKEGAYLDEDGMQILAEMAEASDMQVWVETIAKTGRVAVEISDGAVVGQEIKPRDRKVRKAKAGADEPKAAEDAPQPAAAAPPPAAPADTAPRRLF